MLDCISGWASDLGLNVTKEIGSGEAGVAYLTSQGKVIKHTSHKAEFYLAMKMEGKENKHVVDVYGTKYIDDNNMLILMEKLTISPEINALFAELASEAASQDIDILEIDEDDLIEGLSDEALLLLEEINKAADEVHAFGVIASDIHNDNIGIKDNGNYALIDQFDAYMNEVNFNELVGKRKMESSSKNRKRNKLVPLH